METLSKKKSVLEFIRSLRSMIFLMAAALFFCTFVAQLTYVDGRSMENALEDGDSLVLDKLSYRFQSPERFDVVVFSHLKDTQVKDPRGSSQTDLQASPLGSLHAEKKYYIKRIIGLPGETVYISPSGQIYLNQQPLEEAYGKEPIQNPGLASMPVTLGDDEYFVLGDNRNNSSDSRDPSIGVVHGKEILGRAVFRIYPFTKLGALS